MESIVEDVEDDREKEGSPANSQSFKDSGGGDWMRISVSINHMDGHFRYSHYQGRHCQAENNCEYFYHFIKLKILTSSEE